MQSAFTRFSTTVDVWREDRTPLRTQRELATTSSRGIIFLQGLFWVHTFIFNVLGKTTNSNVFVPCLMQVNFACHICNCLTLLYDHAAPQILIPNINLEIASSLVSLSRLKINIWAHSLTGCSHPCYVAA